MISLYYIQDDDRPMWVVAEDWNSALAKWQEKIVKENEMLLVDIDGPEGITKICDGDDLLL